MEDEFDLKQLPPPPTPPKSEVSFIQTIELPEKEKVPQEKPPPFKREDIMFSSPVSEYSASDGETTIDTTTETLAEGDEIGHGDKSKENNEELSSKTIETDDWLLGESPPLKDDGTSSGSESKTHLSASRPRTVRRSSSVGDIQEIKKLAQKHELTLETIPSAIKLSISMSSPGTPKFNAQSIYSLHSFSTLDSTSNQSQKLSFAEFRKFDVYPGKTRKALSSLTSLNFQDRMVVQQKSLFVPSIRGKVLETRKELGSPLFNGFSTSLSKLNFFKLKETPPLQKSSFSDAHRLHLLRLAILDNKSHLACRVFGDFPGSLLLPRETKISMAVQICLLHAMSKRMDNLCMMMMEKDIVPDINAPALDDYLSGKSYSLPNWFMLALSFDLDKLIKGMYKKANPNKSWYGLTPLQIACCKGKKTSVKKLLEMGADLYHGLNLFKFMKMCHLRVSSDEFDNYPFHHLSQEANTRLSVEEKMKRLELFSNKVILPVELSLATGQNSVFQLLLQKCIKKAMMKSSFGLLLSNEVWALSLLVKAGASVNDQKNLNGANALHLACRRGDMDVVVFFVSFAEADVNSRGENGWTPLHEAIAKRNFSIAHYLRLHGADLNRTNDAGETPIDLTKRIHMTEEEIYDYLSCVPSAPVDENTFTQIEQNVDRLSKMIPNSPNFPSTDPLNFLSPKLKQVIGSEITEGFKRQKSSSALSTFVSLFK